MEITEVRLVLKEDRNLKGFANVTFDNAFVVRGMKIIENNGTHFVAMPSRLRPDGTFQDVAHPINDIMRKKIEDQVPSFYEKELRSHAHAAHMAT